MFENPEAQLSDICSQLGRRPSIRELMWRVKATQAEMRAEVEDSPEWDIANAADIEACYDLTAALMRLTGLTRDELRQLGEYL